MVSPAAPKEALVAGYDTGELQSNKACVQRNKQATSKSPLETVSGNDKPAFAWRVKPSFEGLPLEILQEIYLLTRPEDDSYFIFDHRNGPWVFGRISSVCRAAALGCSRLWSHMLIDFNRLHHPLSLDSGVAIVEEAFRRTGRHLITFEFRWYQSLILDTYATRVLKVITRYSQQWRSATFYAPNGVIGDHISAVYGRVRKLQKISINAGDKREIGVFRGTNIQIAEVVGVSASFLWCNHLKEIISRSGSRAHDVYSILVHFPDITSLTHEGATRIPTHLKKRLAHTNITTLKTHNGDLLGHIILPNLLSLSIGNQSSKLLPFLGKLIPFLRIAQCSLSTLCLSNCNIAAPMRALYDTLELLPTLQSLSVGFYYMEAERASSIDSTLCSLMQMLRQETKYGQGPLLVPRLSHLEFVSKSDEEWTFLDSIFADMVDFREKHGVLDVVRISLAPNPRKTFDNLAEEVLRCLRLVNQRAKTFRVYIHGWHQASIV